MTEPRWRPSVQWVLHVVLFNQVLAVPIALMSVASGVEWTGSFIGASTYTHTIGSLCFLGGALAGALLTTVFGYSMSRHSLLLNLATGASIAMLVTVGKMSSHQLRIALEISEQSLRERELAA